MTISRNQFVSYLRNRRFYDLFIDLGWNNHEGDDLLYEDEIDDVRYEFRIVAERSGFMVLSCEVDHIPAAATLKKIDTHLRPSAQDYICIFTARQEDFHQLWLVPVSKVDKRDLVSVEYVQEGQAEFLFDKVQSFTFSFSETTTIVDVKEHVQQAFLVNSEKVTKKFYQEFQKQHNNFARFIYGIDDDVPTARNKNKQWYTSIMLNRLMFCYFIQKKGFLNGDADYLQHKLSEVKAHEGEDEFFAFYLDFLIHLFHEGLNAPQHDEAFHRKFGNIPYLNGGMFDFHVLEHSYPDIRIKDEAFEQLFAFFDQWHWHLDTRMTASGRDINPDVLGYIFEQYINNRAEMGAYYTKEDITEYIGRNTIVPYLLETTRRHDEKPFKTNGEVWTLLRQSGDSYVFDAVKHGTDCRADIPEEISRGIDTTAPNLLERRSHWNDRTPARFGLPTEIWRETMERFSRYDDVCRHISSGSISTVNDFITLNLNIRQFAYDLLARTRDHRLVKHFYQELQRVTILDPTCGSGAFLFAAMNILEPLYEICISRMEEFHRQNDKLFVDELGEIKDKYRSNIQYFIFKSIILRNLYGVDIMPEAIEIAKLRLFLKMVAVVDADRRQPNMGLDPLPDIDFNIRCGNTLVGYATQQELERDFVNGDVFAIEEFREQVKTEMEKIAKAYEIFKYLQMRQTENMNAFKVAKHELSERLTRLNDLLNHHLHQSTSEQDYATWLHNTQPFHWLAEFYEIIQGHGGFDVIIGNPPYVSMKKISYIESNKSFSCSDLYGFVIRRVIGLIHSTSRHGFIVMHNLAFSRNFHDVRKLLSHYISWYSFYSRIPSGLFSGDVRVRNTVYILAPGDNKVHTTRMHRWFTEQREHLFDTLSYCLAENVDDVIPMSDSQTLMNLFYNYGAPLRLQETRLGGTPIYFKQSAYNWLAVSPYPAPCYDSSGSLIEQTEVSKINIANNDLTKLLILLFNGKLFFTKWLIYGDDFHLTRDDMLDVNIPLEKISPKDKDELCSIYGDFELSLRKSIQYKLNAGKRVGTFNTKKLWPITEQSDKIFAKYLADDVASVLADAESLVSKAVITDRKLNQAINTEEN